MPSDYRFPWQKRFGQTLVTDVELWSPDPDCQFLLRNAIRYPTDDRGDILLLRIEVLHPAVSAPPEVQVSVDGHVARHLGDDDDCFRSVGVFLVAAPKEDHFFLTAIYSDVHASANVKVA